MDRTAGGKGGKGEEIDTRSNLSVRHSRGAGVRYFGFIFTRLPPCVRHRRRPRAITSLPTGTRLPLKR